MPSARPRIANDFVVFNLRWFFHSTSIFWFNSGNPKNIPAISAQASGYEISLLILISELLKLYVKSRRKKSRYYLSAESHTQRKFLVFTSLNWHYIILPWVRLRLPVQLAIIWGSFEDLLSPLRLRSRINSVYHRGLHICGWFNVWEFMLMANRVRHSTEDDH